MYYPSMMNVDFGNLAEEIKNLEAAGVDGFHCDVMDGCFVPNMSMSLCDVRAVKKCASKPVDAHLMIMNPIDKVDWFIKAGCDIIYIHPESERYVVRTLTKLKEAGVIAGLAINPDTPVETVMEMLYVTDRVLCMTVTPGWGGQKYLDFVTNKIKKLVELKNHFKFDLFMDGGATPGIIKDLEKIGVDGFVLGAGVLFGENSNYKTAMDELFSN